MPRGRGLERWRKKESTDQLSAFPNIFQRELAKILRHEHDIGRMDVLDFDDWQSLGTDPEQLQKIREKYGGKAKGLYLLRELASRDEKFNAAPGFVLPIELGEKLRLRTNGRYDRLPQSIKQKLQEQLEKLEQKTGRKFGYSSNPLIISVRSGAEWSLPNAMATVLNVGLNRDSIPALAGRIGLEGAWQSYANFCLTFINAVTGVDMRRLQELFNEANGQQENIIYQVFAKLLEKWFMDNYGIEIPQDVNVQLEMAALAVYGSYDQADAHLARIGLGIPKGHTGVNIVEMVFGNADDREQTVSGSGQVHSHDEEGVPKNQITFANEKQGIAVVDRQSGTKDYIPLAHDLEASDDKQEVILESVIAQLIEQSKLPVDIEFVVEKGQLYIIQTRSARPAPEIRLEIIRQMADRFAGDALGERVKWILKHVDPSILANFERTRFYHESKQPALQSIEVNEAPKVQGDGIGGAITGMLVIVPFGKVSSEEVNLAFARARQSLAKGQNVIILSDALDPNDITRLQGDGGVEALVNRVGFIAIKDNVGSHAANIFRAQGFDAVMGVEDFENQIGDYHYREGDAISLDGATGEIFFQEIKTELASPTNEQRLFAQEVEAVFGKSTFHQLAIKMGLGDQLVAKKEMLGEAMKEAGQYLSLKAQAQILMNKIFPENLLTKYDVMKVDNIEVIIQKIKDGLEAGFDMTIRSALHYTGSDTRYGKNPWVLFKSPDLSDPNRTNKIENQMKLVRAFFENETDYQATCAQQNVEPSKYKSWNTWLSEIADYQSTNLTEVLIGFNPRGKLSPELADQHSVAALTIGPSAVKVRASTHTAQLRSLEAGNDVHHKPENHLNIRVGLDPQAGRLMRRVVSFNQNHLLEQGVTELAEQIHDYNPKKRFIKGSDHQLPGDLMLVHDLICRQLGQYNDGKLAQLSGGNITIDQIEQAIKAILRRGELPDSFLPKVVKKEVLQTVAELSRELFGADEKQWQELVLCMAVLEEKFGGRPITLEFQMRRGKWIDIYGLKGIEERMELLIINPSSD